LRPPPLSTQERSFLRQRVEDLTYEALAKDSALEEARIELREGRERSDELQRALSASEAQLAGVRADLEATAGRLAAAEEAVEEGEHIMGAHAAAEAALAAHATQLSAHLAASVGEVAELLSKVCAAPFRFR
jgi:imidazolonepropionase-like amidohydrolase